MKQFQVFLDMRRAVSRIDSFEIKETDRKTAHEKGWAIPCPIMPAPGPIADVF
jgi:hypothetical protein